MSEPSSIPDELLEIVEDATDPLTQVNSLRRYLTLSDAGLIGIMIDIALDYVYWVIDELNEQESPGTVDLTINDPPGLYVPFVPPLI